MNSRRFSSAALSVALGLSVAAAPTSASAATACVGHAYGVPGLSGGPNWTTGSPPQLKTGLDDPRWAGSTRLYLPESTSPTTEANVRLLVESGNILVANYQITGDPAATSGDTIWFGIGSGTTYFLYELSLGNSIPTTATNAVGTTNAVITAWTSTNGTTWNGALLPVSWLSVVNYWVGGSTDPYTWGVSLKFDLANVGGGATNLFTAAFIDSGLGSAWVSEWPPNAVVANTTTPSINFDETAIDASKWGPITLGTYASPCSDGIALGITQIGASPAPDNIINTSSAGSSHADNVFFAHPSLNGAGITTNGIKAKFRLANWGSTIADPNAGWTTILSDIQSNASGQIDAPGCAAALNNVCGTPLDFSTQDPHQCMLVELSAGSAPPPQLHFAQSSVYRNLDFDTASVLKRQAEISVKGLAPLPNTTVRDTYLYVQTINMPGPSDEAHLLPHEAMRRAVEVAKNPPARPQPRQPDPGEGGKIAARPPAAPKGKAAALEQPPFPLDPDLAKDALEHLESAWPTYLVHVYHDTGRFIVSRGQKYKLLEPQVPFGYFVDHSGPYFGFDHTIEGMNGAQLEALGPNFYRLVVPNNGVAKIVSTITALEKPLGKKECCPSPPIKVEIKPTCHCSTLPVSDNSLLATSLGLAGVACTVLVTRRRRRNRK